MQSDARAEFDNASEHGSHRVAIIHFTAGACVVAIDVFFDDLISLQHGRHCGHGVHVSVGGY